MRRSTHPEAYDYYLKAFETTSKIVDGMLGELVIGIWEAHADIRAGNPLLGMMVEQNDIIIENGVEVLGPNYNGYIGESHEETLIREAAENR